MAKKMTKGVVHVAWGNEIQDELRRSIDSLPDGVEHTIIEPANAGEGHGAKLCMFDESPYDLTLYLDTDTVVLADSLDFVFEAIRRWDLVAAMAPASDAAHQYGFVGHDYLPQYNTGVLGFSKAKIVDHVFREWKRRQVGRFDQPAFARVVYESRVNPYVLPREWNFRGMPLEPQGYGPVKIWHSRKPPPKQKLGGFWRLK